MADREAKELSKHEFSIAYDGAALKAADLHSIDVQALAPALLAFGKLIREANVEFNGKKSTSKVLVVSDFEHKCFSINFEVVLGLFEQLKTLLGTEQAKTAKEILEWLGLLGIPTGVIGGSLSYLAYLKLRNGRKVTTEPLIDSDKSGMIRVVFEGDAHGVEVHTHIHHLAENPKALRATRDALLPLGEDGYDNVKVRQNGVTVEEIPQDQVEAIVRSCNVGIEESKVIEEIDPEVEETPAWLSVYSPVYDATAANWRFRLGKDIIYADISNTDIARQALARGGVNVEEAYQVRLEITTEFDEKGEKKDPTYKVLEVVRFVEAGPSPRQSNLFDKP